MIYDCFGFFNELELLDLRLHELAGVVDKFVLVEATKTHSNKPKPLYYRENRSQFSEFHDKIIHVVVDDLPDSGDAFLLDNYQRKCIARGLVNCRPDDWILISDLDEIPRASVVKKLSQEIRFHDNFLADVVHGALSSKLTQKIFHRRGLRRQLRRNHPYIWRFEQQQYVHFLNARTPTLSLGTRMLRFRDFTCAEEMRYSGYKTIKNAGWHFTWMGGVDRIRAKLAAYAHQDLNQPQYNNPEVIANQINRGLIMWADDEQPLEIVALDDSFPQYLRQQPENFSHLLNLSTHESKSN